MTTVNAFERLADVSWKWEAPLRPSNDRPWVKTEMLLWMVFLIVVTIATYILFPKYVTKAIPGSLAGIVVSTIFEWALIRPLGYETNTVEDLAIVAGSFPVPVWVDTKYDYQSQLPPFNGQLIGEIFPTAVTAAVIGLLESLLTLQIIDELTNTKGSPIEKPSAKALVTFFRACWVEWAAAPRFFNRS